MITATPSTALDRAGLLERFTRMRQRTRAFFDLLDESEYFERPIRLRNPVVFYEGHMPAFAVNTLIKKGLGRSGIDELWCANNHAAHQHAHAALDSSRYS
jgi:hypothetical protein